MKFLIVSLFLLAVFGGCSTSHINHDGSYDQANSASQKAHMELHRDVK